MENVKDHRTVRGFSLNEQEMQSIRTRAEELQISMSAYIRMACAKEMSNKESAE